MYGTRTVNYDGIEWRVDCLWALPSVEIIQVYLVRDLVYIASDPDRVLARRDWRIVCVVELNEARDRDHIGTVYAKKRIRKHRRVRVDTRVSSGGRAYSEAEVENPWDDKANVGEMEGGGHRLWAAKVSRRLHEVDVRV